MNPPVKPSESDCCNSGCNPCILDVYEQHLKIYEQKKSNTLRKTYANCMSPTSYTIFELVSLDRQSKETFLFTFKYIKPLRDGDSCSDLNILYEPGQHFLLKAEAKGEEFTRAYTPIPINHSPLKFTVLIKLYDHGKMSNHLKTIKIGSRTLWRGPYGEFRVNYNHKFLLAIAQGTGISPIFSVLYDMVNKEDCYTFLKLLYCCKDCENIYLRDQLHDLSSNWNFTYEIFLSKSSKDCYARYNETIHNNKLEFSDIDNCLLDKYEVAYVLICGSEAFTESIRTNMLHCKVKEENVFTF